MKKYLVFTITIIFFIILIVNCSDSSNPTTPQQNKTSAWTHKSNMSIARAAFGISMFNGKIYVIGGETLDNDIPKVLSSVELYDPENDTWTEKAPMITPRTALTTCESNGKIYAIGGTKAETEWPFEAETIVEEYDPVLNTWQSKESMKFGRLLFTACCVEGKIYVFGGGNEITTSSVEMYDPEINKWVDRASMPTKRGDLSSCALDNKIVVIGGDLGSPAYLGMNTVEVYDHKTDTWDKSIPDMLTPRTCFSACSCNGKIFVFGGASGSYNNSNYSNVEMYDPEQNKWISKENMPLPKNGHQSIAVNGLIYVIGGFASDSYLSSVDVYNPELDTN